MNFQYRNPWDKAIRSGPRRSFFFVIQLGPALETGAVFAAVAVVHVHGLILWAGAVGEDMAHAEDFAVEVHTRVYVDDIDGEMVESMAERLWICVAIVASCEGLC